MKKDDRNTRSIARLWRRIAWSRLLRSQRGAVALTFLLTSTIMLACVLGSIDIVRHNVAQARVQNALDAAVISAGRGLGVYNPHAGSVDEQAWRDDAYHYFKSNVSHGLLGGDIPKENFSIEYIEERSGTNDQWLAGQFVRMNVTGSLPLISTGFLDWTSLKLYASNEAVRRTRTALELVLALDNTGSMAFDSPTRMSVLKTSAKDLVKTVLDAGDAAREAGAPDDVFIGLVPFTDVVNVSRITTARSWLTYPPAMQNYIQHRWSGCIAEPAGNWSSNNPLPAQALLPTSGFQPFFSTYSALYRPPNLPSYAKLLNRIPGQQANDPYPVFTTWNPELDRRILARVPQSATDAQERFQINLAVEPTYCIDTPALFLSNERELLNTSITDMRAYGGTGVPAGLLWAWRMLEPNWRGAGGWGNVDMPRDPEPGHLNKVIVLLTDGENEPVMRRRLQPSRQEAQFRLKYAYVNCTKMEQTWWSTRCVQWAPENNAQVRTDDIQLQINDFNQCPVDALKMHDPTRITPDNRQSECRAADTTIGYPSRGTTAPEPLGTQAYDSYMAELCNNVKSDGNGIRIYAVTLGADVSVSAKNLMRSCASGPGYYFDAQNVHDLPLVFESIAGALTELRLTH